MSENKHKYCMYCGTKLENDWLFCKECGNKLEKVLEEDTIVEETNVIVNDIESDEIQNSVEENVEASEETVDEVETIVEEVPDTVYILNKEHLVEHYNFFSKQNSLMSVWYFTLPFLLLITTKGSIFTLLSLIVAIAFTIVVIVYNTNNKRNAELLSQSEGKIEVREDEFVIEEYKDNYYERHIYKYDEILAVCESDFLIEITTKRRRIHVIEKEALLDKEIEFKNNILKYAKKYNGLLVKKDEILKGKYDYYKETKTTINVARAVFKGMNSLFYMFFFVVLVLFVVLYFELNTIFVLPNVIAAILNLIYVSKINKKMPHNYKLVKDIVFSIIVIAVSGLFVLMGISSLL